ncbi:YaaR family protein [Gorillibacterium sp. sgz5001074]|uniref:YaaR family protein n=1 Tax=Gorillibacterium sp. sgz5001074 TaxID=3446695 RepID=UPI003F66F408
MKINPGWRPLGQEIRRTESAPSPAVEGKSFSDNLRQQDERAGQEQLNKLLEQIHLQGERLSKSMTVRELRQYKLLIKQFLEETARRGVGLKDTRGWDRRGRTKRYKVLDEIDEHLLAMADELLETEQGKIEILYRVGEIKGMLINLSF